MVYGLYFFGYKRHTIDLTTRRRCKDGAVTRVYYTEVWRRCKPVVVVVVVVEKLVSIKAAAAVSYRFGPREVEVTGVGSYY